MTTQEERNIIAVIVKPSPVLQTVPLVHRRQPVRCATAATLCKTAGASKRPPVPQIARNAIHHLVPAQNATAGTS